MEGPEREGNLPKGTQQVNQKPGLELLPWPSSHSTHTLSQGPDPHPPTCLLHGHPGKATLGKRHPWAGNQGPCSLVVVVVVGGNQPFLSHPQAPR